VACLLKYKAGSQTCSATLRTTLRSRYTAFRSGRITQRMRFGARLAPLPYFCSRWSQKHRIRWNVRRNLISAHLFQNFYVRADGVETFGNSFITAINHIHIAQNGYAFRGKHGNENNHRRAKGGRTDNLCGF